MAKLPPAVPPPTNRQEDLRALLHALRLGRMEATFADIALKASRDGLTHEAFLYTSPAHMLRISYHRERGLIAR